MKAIILARVSDEKQDSNEAQITRILKYVQDRKLEEWKTFEIKESSTTGDRKKFQEIIDLVKTSKETIALVVDTVDRLQRSFKESVMLDEFRKDGKLEIHFYRENLIINRNSNSSDILRWDMAVMFAKSYVLQLSDNVKRKQEQMRKNGEWPSKPPVGYSSVYDDQNKRINIIPNPEKRHNIRRIFEEYAKGDVSIKTLSERMYDQGLRSDKGYKVVPSIIHNILNNSFYYGEAYSSRHDFRYVHKYEPIIPKELFNTCQSVLNKSNTTPIKYASKPFIFKGLVVCKDCGGAVSGDLKKKKYVYYSCSGYKGCKRQFVPETELLKPVYELLDNIKLSDEQIAKVVEDMKAVGANEQSFHKESMSALKTEYDKYQNRIERMYQDHLDEKIDENMYSKLLSQYKGKQEELINQMKNHSDGDESFYITAGMVLNLAQRAKDIFKSSKVDEKRQLLGFLLSNSVLSGKKLEFSIRSPFDVLSNCKGDLVGLRGQDSNL